MRVDVNACSRKATARILNVCSSLIAGYGTFMGGESPMQAVNAVPFHDSRRKWLMVAILSALTAINQGICYSYAPIASIAETRWQERVSLSLSLCPALDLNRSIAHSSTLRSLA